MRFVELFRKRLPLRLLVILCSYKLLLYSSRSRHIHSIAHFLAQWTFGKGDRSFEPQKLMVNPKWINALGVKWSQLLYKFEHTPLRWPNVVNITHMLLFKCYESSLSSWIQRLTSPFFCLLGCSLFRSSSRVCLLFFGETRLKLILLHHIDIHVWKKYGTYSTIYIYIYMEEIRYMQCTTVLINVRLFTFKPTTDVETFDLLSLSIALKVDFERTPFTWVNARKHTQRAYYMYQQQLWMPS